MLQSVFSEIDNAYHPGAEAGQSHTFVHTMRKGTVHETTEECHQCQHHITRLNATRLKIIKEVQSDQRYANSAML